MVKGGGLKVFEILGLLVWHDSRGSKVCASECVLS